MLDFLYQTGWGAFTVLLFFQIPFLIVFLYIVFRKSLVDSGPSDTDAKKITRLEWVWMGVVVVLFLAVNITSIQYIPAISTAKAAAAGGDILNVNVTAASWNYDMSEEELVTGRPIRFTAKSADTVHGFAIYHPNGKVLFTMMLIPGASPSSLIYTFKDAGTYTVRCLEYCGISHHQMRDELVVKAAETTTTTTE